ncbi:MAG: hypothetical protein WD016_02995 [Balneolaceae bacterium]
MAEIKGIKKLYEAKKTNLPTEMSAHYYGRADGNIYVIYGAPYHTRSGAGKTKYVFARLDNCSYNEKGQVFKNGELLETEFEGYRELDSQNTHKHLKVIEERKVSKELYQQVERDFFKSEELPMIRKK